MITHVGYVSSWSVTVYQWHLNVAQILALEGKAAEAPMVDYGNDAPRVPRGIATKQSSIAIAT